MTIKDRMIKQFTEVLNTKRGELHPICIFDRIMRQDGIAEELLTYLEEDIRNGIVSENIVIICSGNFGYYVKKVFEPNFKVIHVKGGLRTKEDINLDLGNIPMGIKFVFIDDSIHTCRTQSRIIKVVEATKGKVVAAYYGFIAGYSPMIKHVRCILYKDEIKGDRTNGRKKY